ncbi:hypothetical protein [Paenibacillus sp. KN14-4R]|uniref:hypothetical protein n=1 Tax=Paenibacillus sp. KN14-4R TaxID=3445773 RepID=UPI003F9F8170
MERIKFIFNKYMFSSIISSILFIFLVNFYYGSIKPYLNEPYLEFFSDFDEIEKAIIFFKFYPVFIIVGTPTAYVLDLFSMKLSNSLVIRLIISFVLYIITGGVISVLYTFYIGMFTVLIIKVGLVAVTILYITITTIRFKTILKTSTRIL